MLIFWRLLFAHLLADFTFQTNFINRWKRASLAGMLAHCVTHPVCSVALTYPYLGEVWLDLGPLRLSGWACVLVLFVAHFVEDQWRVYHVIKTRTPDNTLYFLWDQLVHYAVIFAVAPEGTAGGLIPEAWPFLGCLLVIVTHACTVLIYFLEKDLKNMVFPGTEEKYLSMAERLVLSLCFLIPSNLFLLLALGWLAVMHAIRSKRWLDLSWLSFYLGGAVAVSSGVAARMVYYP